LRFDFCTTKSSPQFGSTDAAANVLDDFHVGFQRSGGIFAFPRDTSLGRHGRRDWAKHDIFVREFFKLLGHEGDTQAGEMAWIIVRSRSTSCKTFGVKPARV
jgi:hypothetical protein